MSWNQVGESRYGIHSIDHFALEVPSLEKARHFFTSFGLQVADEGEGLALRTYGNSHVWGRLQEGRRKQLAYLSLNCWADEYDGLRAQVLAHGARAASAPRGACGTGLWFTDPDGNLIQLQVGPKTTPTGPGSHCGDGHRRGERHILGRSRSTTIHPRRLSHLLLFSADINRSIAFYRDALGLRLSDRSNDAVAFMHARHGSDHHLVAFAGSTARGWHHSSWDVAGIDEVGRGAEQMRCAGYAEGWGCGRHVLGSNYFHYVRDPWGSFAEYSADMDFIPTGQVWRAGDYPPEDSLYLWGPAVPQYFIHNTEA